MCTECAHSFSRGLGRQAYKDDRGGTVLHKSTLIKQQSTGAEETPGVVTRCCDEPSHSKRKSQPRPMATSSILTLRNMQLKVVG